MAKSVIVSYESAFGVDNSVLIVGEKLPGDVVNVINAFQGDEANELWQRLITKKEKNNDF